jgi:hypothetical protein
MKLRKPSILVVNWVSPCLSFRLSVSTAATYIFTAPNWTTAITSLEPCALNAELQHFMLRFNKLSLLCGYQQRFYLDEFSPLGDKKKGLTNLTKGILEFVWKNGDILRKKKQVARFRQCVIVGRQNWAGFPKKSNCPPRQSPFTAN